MLNKNKNKQKIVSNNMNQMCTTVTTETSYVDNE